MTEKEKKAEIVRQELKNLYPQDPKFPLNYKNPWELLVAVVLSARTTDTQVNKVTKDLFQKYKTLDDYAKADLKEFEKDINSIGLYKSKAKNIIESAKKIKKECGGKLPKKMGAMTGLPGVGKKSANVILGEGFGVVEGIVVDTHVKRLAQKFGLTKEKTPEKIEEDLKDLIPKEEWWVFANRLKLYGQEYSPARKKDNTDPISQKLKKLKS